jgi:hypothetical protein
MSLRHIWLQVNLLNAGIRNDLFTRLINIIYDRIDQGIYTGNLISLVLTFRIKTDTQSFKPNTNFITIAKITIIITIDNGVTIRIFSITFNTSKLEE